MTNDASDTLQSYASILFDLDGDADLDAKIYPTRDNVGWRHLFKDFSREMSQLCDQSLEQLFGRR